MLTKWGVALKSWKEYLQRQGGRIACPMLWMDAFASVGESVADVQLWTPHVIHSGTHTIKAAPRDVHGYLYRFAVTESR